MLHKLSKGIFNLISEALKFSQVCLIFLSVFVIAYWVLSLSGAPIIQSVAPFFESIRNTVHLFYNSNVRIDQAAIDFSFLIAAAIFLMTAFILKFVIDIVEIFEEKYERLYEAYKTHTEKVFNAQLEREYLEEEKKNNKTLILVKFHATPMSKGSLYKEEAQVSTEKKEKEVLFDFFEILDEDFDCKKEIVENSMLLYFDDIDNIDKFLTDLKSILKSIKIKYAEDKWQVSYSAGIEIYAQKVETEAKQEVIKKLVRLKLEDKILCLSPFKHRYSLLNSKLHNFSTEGFYTIINNEEVFSIIP